MTKDKQFEVTYNKSYRNLMRYAMTIVHEEHTAEDMVQNAFTELWEKFETVRHPEAWLYSAVESNCCNYIRDAKKVQLLEDETLLEDPAPAPEEILAEEIYYREIVRDVNERLEKKSPRWYNLIYNLFVRNYSQEETAMIMSMNTNQLRAILCRIRQWLGSEMRVAWIS